jgi:hypothetical protein
MNSSNDERRKYIFLTGEGTTAAPNGDDVENFQVLGFSYGVNLESAKQIFFKENGWIFSMGFSEDEIRTFELADRSE